MALLQEEGIAAVASYTSTSATHCTEVRRVSCVPFEPETTDCPCGAAQVPGRGCPNPVGPGARLHLHGSFNPLLIERAIVEGLPPGSTTVLAIGRPLQSLPAGNARGDGIVCLLAPAAWVVGVADQSGSVTFNDVIPPTPYLLNGSPAISSPSKPSIARARPEPAARVGTLRTRSYSPSTT